MNEKPGFKTSEFWLVALTVVLGFAMSWGMFSQEEATVVRASGLALVNAIGSALPAIGAAGATMVYTLSRAWVKR